MVGGVKSVLSPIHEKYLAILVPIVVNNPPAKRFNSWSFPSAYTVLPALGLKVVSNTPAEEYLAIRFLVPQVTVVKVPPNMILPEFSIRIVYTTGVPPVTFGLKVLSITPTGLTLAILFLPAPATFVNCHPNTINPLV